MRFEEIIEILEDIATRYENAHHDWYTCGDISMDIDDYRAVEQAVKIIKNLKGTVDFIKDSIKER